MSLPPRVMDFHRKGGTLSLDLVGTLYDWQDRRMERLTSPARLDEWFAFIHLPAVSCGSSQNDLRLVRELRGALYDVVRAVVDGVHPEPVALERVNSTAAQAIPVRALAADGRSVAAAGAPRPKALLALIARDAVELLSGPDVERLRECEGSDCSMLFVDHSRSGHRRWCSMKGCGEKAAAAAYRQRRAQSVPSAV